MTLLTADDFATQMVAQAQIQDPSFSGAIGTPERKILDTVAQALADNQIDLTGLGSALDIDSKVGSNLDQFTAMFGFQRQQSTAGTGFVVYSRNTPALSNTVIPQGSTIQANAVNVNTPTSVQYTTTAAGAIPAGGTSSQPIPVQAISTGSATNVAANTLTQMVGTPVGGVTAVTNPLAITNATDSEDDNSYKVRFQNTWARNLAGTSSQYLALALAGTFTTKANVIGQQSRYQEYIQVPDYDDAGYLAGVQSASEDTFGQVGLWTTALSDIPYAKQIFTTTAAFISDDQINPTYFYNPGSDFQFNSPAILAGDALRDSLNAQATGTQTLPTGTITVESTFGFPSAGALYAGTGSLASNFVTYTGVNYGTNQFTGCSGGSGTIDDGTPLYLVPTAPTPNFTFLNVFNPIVDLAAEGLRVVDPGDVVLSEYSYVSSASRNDLVRNINNAVDMYVDGANDVQASSIFLPNVTGPNSSFSNDPTSPWYYENFRRDGEPTKRPLIGNYLTSLYQAPLDGLPPVISVAGQNFYLGVHYWLVHEIGDLAGSIRARDGIEWQNMLYGDLNSTTPLADQPGPTGVYVPTPASPPGDIYTFSTPSTAQVVEVDDYLYDSNIITMQASCEAAKQITTDVLVHKASLRYFKLDVTVMYSPNSSPAVTNAAIATSVQAYMGNQYYGTVVQLSDLLEIIHEVPGVDNVRWSNDLPIAPNSIRVTETDINGVPLYGASVDRLQYGVLSTSPEWQGLYIVGSPSGLVNTVPDSFTLSWNDPNDNGGTIPNSGNTMTTAAIPFYNVTSGAPVSASAIQTAIQAAAVAAGATGMYSGITVSQDARSIINVVDPITSFRIIYGDGTPVLPTVTNNVTVSTYTFNSDFFLLDDQLPSLPANALGTDTLPGLIIRVRAQNTWLRPGLG